MPVPTLQKAVAALVLGLSVFWSAAAGAANVRDRIVAVVNSEIIMLSEMEEEVAEVKAQMRQRFSSPMISFGQ